MVTSKGQKIDLYGTSIEKATPWANPSYGSKLADWLGMKLLNNGQSGNCYWKAQDIAFTSMPPVGNNVMVVVGGPYNCMRMFGATTNSVNMILNTARGIISNAFLGQVWAASQVTKSGTYSEVNTIPYGGKSGRINSLYRGIKLEAEGSFVEKEFTGDNIVIGFVGTDGVVNDYGEFAVFVDGYLMKLLKSNEQAPGITLSTYNHQFVPGALVFSHLENTTHTVKIVSLDSRPVLIDYFGVMKDPSLCKPVILSHCMKMTAAGYVATSANKGSDEAVDIINMNLNSLEHDFCDRPFVVTKHPNYDPATTATTDHVHPPDPGHDQLFEDVKTGITIGPAENDSAWDAIGVSGVNVIDTSGILTGVNAGYGNIGLGNKRLLLGTDGEIKFQYVDTAQRLCVIGYTNNGAVSFNAMPFAMYINSTEIIILKQSGATINTGIKAIAGMHYSIRIVGQDVEARSSVDGNVFNFLWAFTAQRTTNLDSCVDVYGGKQINHFKSLNLI